MTEPGSASPATANDSLQSAQTLGQALARARYLADPPIALSLWLALRMERPLMLEGPAGVGKTDLARATAEALGRPLLRLQCYEGLDEAKALYEWDYARQMLYTQLLRDAVAVETKGLNIADAARIVAKSEASFFSEHFLLPRPLLKALTSDEPVVLLIDEIDRADVEFEAFLLEVLSDFQVSVPELGTIRAKHQPMVLLTSNNTRELSEALKRRCLYLYVGYPNLEAELDIVRLKVPDLRPEMARQAVAVVQQLRNMDLRKVPSISETLDWARALVALNARAIDEQTMNNTLTVLLKYEADVQKAKRMMGNGGRSRPSGR